LLFDDKLLDELLLLFALLTEDTEELSLLAEDTEETEETDEAPGDLGSSSSSSFFSSSVGGTAGGGGGIAGGGVAGRKGFFSSVFRSRERERRLLSSFVDSVALVLPGSAKFSKRLFVFRSVSGGFSNPNCISIASNALFTSAMCFILCVTGLTWVPGGPAGGRNGKLLGVCIMLEDILGSGYACRRDGDEGWW